MAVVWCIEEQLLPHGVVSSRDGGLVVDEDIAAHGRLVGRHDDARHPLGPQVLAHPLELILCAIARAEHGRCAQEDTVSLGGKGLEGRRTASHLGEVPEEALRVVELRCLLAEGCGHARLHRVALSSVDGRAAAPGVGKAAVPVDEHAVHIDEDDRCGHGEGCRTVVAHHALVRERLHGVFLRRRAHLEPAPLPVGIRRSELRERVLERLLVLGRVSKAVRPVDEHLGDAGNVSSHHGHRAHHRLGDHHWRHLVERREEQHVRLPIELVNVVRHVMQLDA
mmetsp:Transcript_22060/g.56313  ORF Transcript_22060/g.56313 Transcript_22060/m.56313 type:complete len:280 (+) Transcript_22060:935-1774(+)